MPMSMFTVSEVRDYTSHSAPGRCSEKAQPYPVSLFVKLKKLRWSICFRNIAFKLKRLTLIKPALYCLKVYLTPIFAFYSRIRNPTARPATRLRCRDIMAASA